MLLEVEHWSGAGNRFVIVDNRKQGINSPWDPLLVKTLCRRITLPNAEGLLVLLEIDKQNSSCNYDFYNPDGSTGLMCGNGARCAVRHAVLTNSLDVNEIELTLNGCSYTAQLVDNDCVALRLPLYKEFRLIDSWTYVNVGSHHVIIDARDLVQSIEEFYRFDLIKFANENLDFYRNKVGISYLNLNIAYPINDQATIQLRTYENGVYDETQACGTGAVSTAIAFWKRNIIRNTRIQLIPKSQRILTVHLDIDDKEENILAMILEGDARQDAFSSQFDTRSMQYQ
jgi:diaminopimelate epimerase